MFSYGKPPTISDGTVLEYLPGSSAHLCVDASSNKTWSCYCVGTLPLELGDKVTVYNKKGLFSHKFRLVHKKGQLVTNLVEYTKGAPRSGDAY